MKRIISSSVFYNFIFLFLLMFSITIQAQKETVKKVEKKNGVTLTDSDIKMANEVISENTYSLPGFTTGSHSNVSTGKFSEADALVLYMLKFHHRNKVCPPIKVVAEAVEKINDTNIHKKAVTIFWKDYSTTSDLNENLDKPGRLHDDFEFYILTKQTERLKIQNAKLQGFVGSDEAWRKAMNSQEKSWQKSKEREDEYILTRDTYRVILDAQAAVAAAKYAVASTQ